MAATETQEIVVDFGKICRLCLTEDGVLLSLFSTDSLLENTLKSVPERISDLMAIKITENDGFPSWICHNCLSQVDRCYDFFDMCRSSQITLNDSYIKALSDAGIEFPSTKVYFNHIENDDSDLAGTQQNINIEIINNEIEYPVEAECAVEVDVPKEISENDLPRIDEEVNKNENESNKYFCSDCAKEFTNKDELSVHRISVHHDDLITETTVEKEKVKYTGLWTCEFCGDTFRSRGAILTHFRFRHMMEEKKVAGYYNKFIACKYCGSSFSRKFMLRHLEIVHRLRKNLEMEPTDMDSFDCKICYRPFMRQSSLRNHLEKFHGDSLEMIAEAENCDVVWNCSECDSLFSEKVFLMQHYGNKHSKYPLEMDSLKVLKSRNLICTCGMITSSSFDFFIHEIYHHKEESEKTIPLECPACHEIFIYLDHLKKHLIAYHWFVTSSYENECTLCGKEFGSNQSLRIHLRELHDVRFSSLPSEERFINEDMKKGKNENKNKSPSNGEVDVSVVSDCVVELKDKVKNGTYPGKESLFVCESCGDYYENEEELKKHRNACQETHTCEICNKVYKSDNHLKRHIIDYHNTVAPVKCPLCPKVFPRKMNLHNHYKRRHLKQTKNFVCSFCGLALKGKVALKSHEDRVHRNIRSFKCPECPEAFTTESILQKHAQRHMAERPMLQCQYCERKFSTISGIERHVKIHEGKKDFICEIPSCQKPFYTKSELKRHIKFHNKDFRHVCPVCNHKFMSPGELRKHSTKHTGERPFKCHLCSCTYARRDDKVKHLKRVHNLKVKRIYGKPLRKHSNEDDEPIDNIVVDEDCPAEVAPSEDAVTAKENVPQ